MDPVDIQTALIHFTSETEIGKIYLIDKKMILDVTHLCSYLLGYNGSLDGPCDPSKQS